MSAKRMVPTTATAEALEITTEERAGDVRLRLHGELDLASAERLDERIDAVAADPGRRLLIDLSEMTFMDSAGLRSLLRAQRRQGGAGREVIVMAPSAHVDDVFAVTGARDRLNVVHPEVGLP